MTDSPKPAGGITEDALLAGKVRLWQPRRGHRAGTDAVLLAGLADARAGDTVVDLGSASGAVGLMIAARVDLARLVLIDRDPALIALAQANIGLNGAEGRATALVADAFATEADLRGAYAPVGAADLVVTNPPFFDHAAKPSPEPGRRAAHVMQGGGLADWLRGARAMLKPRGRAVLIHRADELAACLDAVRTVFGSITVVPIYPRAGAEASRIVISARLGGRSPFRLLPPLVLHELDGRFTQEAARLHAGP